MPRTSLLRRTLDQGARTAGAEDAWFAAALCAPDAACRPSRIACRSPCETNGCCSGVSLAVTYPTRPPTAPSLAQKQTEAREPWTSITYVIMGLVKPAPAPTAA